MKSVRFKCTVEGRLYWSEWPFWVCAACKFGYAAIEEVCEHCGRRRENTDFDGVEVAYYFAHMQISSGTFKSEDMQYITTFPALWDYARTLLA